MYKTMQIDRDMYKLTESNSPTCSRCSEISAVKHMTWENPFDVIYQPSATSQINHNLDKNVDAKYHLTGWHSVFCFEIA